ncbi:MAG: tyrosine-type recombinase/integrase [Proteobacteria bacterium]|nr:tyrosine-type recombinase/integrase [Pseudomonadota bacterium]
MKRKIPEVLTDDERAALLEAPSTRYPTGLRNLCMLRVMLDAGLRVGELVNLEPRDINMTSGKLHVHQGKGGKDRVLWLGEDDIELIGRWLEVRPRGKKLFTTLKGGPLDTRYIRAMVERVAARAGINRRIHPHLLRHSFATDLLRDTGRLDLVQKALGHSSIQTTSIYLHLVDGELESALKFFRAGPVTAPAI